MNWKIFATTAAFAIATSAQADWQRAESTHYIVYGNLKPEEIRAATEKLEKYAFVISTVSGRSIPSSPIKLKIYMLADMDGVQDTMPYPAYGVAGYYRPQIRGPFLVTPRLGRAEREVSTDRARIVVGTDYNLVSYHELAHHFMFQNFTAAYPTWYSEGFADFYGTFRLQESNDGDRVEIGQPHEWRLLSMQRSAWLPMRKLLTARSYADVGENIGALYSEGWLLVHYAANNKERGAQLKQYLDLINGGSSYTEAANHAFGNDLDKLDDELKAYARSSKINVLAYSFKKIPPGPIEVRPLSAAETALWRADLKLSGGVARTDADPFARQVRRAAAPFSSDPYAIRILTETEQLMGNRAAAKAAVQRWIALTPRDPLAMLHDSEIRVAELKDAKTPAGDPRWEQVRAELLAANKLDHSEPRILKAYYDSFAAEGVLPPPSAQNALMKALKLVPDDDDMRKQVAKDFEARNMIPEAIAVIRPIAYQLKPDGELSARERAKRDKDRVKYGLQGEDDTDETARDILVRLEKKLPADKNDDQVAKTVG